MKLGRGYYKSRYGVESRPPDLGKDKDALLCGTTNSNVDKSIPKQVAANVARIYIAAVLDEYIRKLMKEAGADDKNNHVEQRKLIVMTRYVALTSDDGAAKEDKNVTRINARLSFNKRI